MPLEPALQELVDQAAIHDLMVRYFSAVDRRDWDKLRACFAPDAYAEYLVATASGFKGILEICKGVERYEMTMHFMGNQLIEVHGDTADMETTAIDFFRYTKDGTTLDRWGELRYVDKLARRDGRWEIFHRVVIRDWRREEALALPV